MFPNFPPYSYGYNYSKNTNYVHNSGNNTKDTIPFKNDNNETNNSSNEDEKPSQEDKKSRGINIFGIDLQIDDLIIIALICLLFLDLDKNYTLIIILGLILLNVNLSDLINLF